MRKPMPSIKCLADPLGHLIMIHDAYRVCESVEKLIADPAFIIEIGLEERYYFRKVDWKMNLLIAARTDHAWYLAETCIQCPTPIYISTLLRRGGRLISFPL